MYQEKYADHESEFHTGSVETRVTNDHHSGVSSGLHARCHTEDQNEEESEDDDEEEDEEEEDEEEDDDYERSSLSRTHSWITLEKQSPKDEMQKLSRC
ncbi:hypothetical protein C0J45_15452 [Silurus meridionalis]|nr:hypothetical protein C0J45_15452 [Silurus meridionalis]